MLYEVITVTTTVLRLVPVQAREIGIVATGPGLPPEVPHVSLWRVPFLPRRTRVWHARRNNEMVLGRITSYNVCYTKLLRQESKRA